MCVLTNDEVIEASQLRRLRAILDLLDGLCCLPKRHVDADIVDCELKLQNVFNRHRVDDLIFFHRE